MKQYTLIIADPSEDFREALREQLNSFCQVYTCGSGMEAAELMRKVHPDVLVLDLMIGDLDGLSLLWALSGAGFCPGILALSAYVSDYILETAEKLGVSYFLEKPCELGKAAEAVRLLLRSRCAHNWRDRYSRISELLLSLGFCPKLRGYTYLRQAALMLAEDPGKCMIKELYPAVAGVYGVSPEDVEHSIRSAAVDAWSHREPDTWAAYFPSVAGKNADRPSNGALIQGLARAASGEEATLLTGIL